MEPKSVEVDESGVGKRLDRFLADQLGVSRARIRHLLEVGRIRWGTALLELTDKSRSTRLGEVFLIEGALLATDERPTARPDLPLEILAEGRGWIVVNKPAGAGVHPLRLDQEDTVLNAVLARHPEILGVGEGGLRSGVVHRLDVDTTGALAFATTDEVWKRLRGAFTEHRVRKTYLAIVTGRFETRRRIELSLAVSKHRPARVSVVETGGTTCRQRVTPKRVFANATLVEIELETGFLHQIRSTLAHLGHPILGDVDYGAPSTGVGGSAIPTVVARPMLHATRLSVDEIAVRIDPPVDFAAILEALESLETSEAPEALEAQTETDHSE